MDAESTENKHNVTPEREGREQFDCPTRLAKAFLASKSHLRFLGGKRWEFVEDGEIKFTETWEVEVKVIEFLRDECLREYVELQNRNRIRKLQISLVSKTMRELKELAAVGEGE